MNHHFRGSMNCSGVKYISKYIRGEMLECWIIDKAVKHMLGCEAYKVGDCGQRGTELGEHINECDRCNKKYRIGSHASVVQKLRVNEGVPDNTARLNQFRYSVPRDLNRWIPTGRR